jgi:hypothetical protein
VAIFGSLLTNQFAPAFRGALSPQITAAVPPDRLAQLQNPQLLLNPEAAAIREQFTAQGPQRGVAATKERVLLFDSNACEPQGNEFSFVVESLRAFSPGAPPLDPARQLPARPLL